jgi:hypothetical protein
MTGNSSKITSLQDKQAFPPYTECPHENPLFDTYYYHERPDGVYAPTRHWCFLGEITSRMVFNRLCLRVKDDKGEEVSANFHLNSPEGGFRVFEPGMSNFPLHHNVPEALVKEGNTIAILYAQRHLFMDGSIGFRIEDADLVQVNAISWEKLSLTHTRAV